MLWIAETKGTVFGKMYCTYSVRTCTYIFHFAHTVHTIHNLYSSIWQTSIFSLPTIFSIVNFWFVKLFTTTVVSYIPIAKNFYPHVLYVFFITASIFINQPTHLQKKTLYRNLFYKIANIIHIIDKIKHNFSKWRWKSADRPSRMNPDLGRITLVVCTVRRGPVPVTWHPSWLDQSLIERLMTDFVWFLTDLLILCFGLQTS